MMPDAKSNIIWAQYEWLRTVCKCVYLVENTVYIDKQVQTNTEFAENGAAESAFISSSLLL